MDAGLIVSNLLNAPVLFFFLGMLAVWVGSDLTIPPPLPKFFSLYLLMAIGFKGGTELSKNGITPELVYVLGSALAVSAIFPFILFPVLRKFFNKEDAAAIAAAYGSVSAVTFITAVSFLQKIEIPYAGYMVAALAVMESPSIIAGISLYKKSSGTADAIPFKELLKEAVFNGSVFVLTGSMVIGILTGSGGEKDLAPFVQYLFKGILCLFLLDMGLISAGRIKASNTITKTVIALAVIIPLLQAIPGIGISYILGLTTGDAFLFTVLCASASYIAVPAAIRMAIPEANPGTYVTMALALTFPFNVIVGLPLYLYIIQYFIK